jgi:hypothetical protein
MHNARDTGDNQDHTGRRKVGGSVDLWLQMGWDGAV